MKRAIIPPYSRAKVAAFLRELADLIDRNEVEISAHAVTVSVRKQINPQTGEPEEATSFGAEISVVVQSREAWEAINKPIPSFGKNSPTRFIVFNNSLINIDKAYICLYNLS